MSGGPETTAPRAAGAAPPWDLAFLRVGLLITLPLTALAVLLVGALLSWPDAVSVLIGAAVVTSFFCVSGLVVTWAGRVHDSYTLPAALGTFMVKMLLLVAVLNALPPDGWVDRRVLGWTVVAGALLWSVVQARWVWVKPLYYVTPPGPPAPAGGVRKEQRTAGAQGAPGDPENRTTRG
jgi:hypothetical protein